MAAHPKDRISTENTLTRRGMLGAAAGAAAAATVSTHAVADHHAGGRAVKKGRIAQSVCKWCYRKTSLEELARASAGMGLVGIDLIDPKDFHILKKHGLVGTMTPSHGITKGLNDPKNWDDCLSKIKAAIDATAAEGWKNVICFSGNRDGMDDETGMNNCAEALGKVVDYAKQKNVVINMELLNSRVNHPDYMCDKSAWGVELCKKVGSDNFKLLYDIYHMQIMEGDLIRTIQRDHQYFGHYHTAGNPGRHEMDETQEMWYPAIVRAIIDTGYEGYLGQEFIPTRDELTSLREAVQLCDV